MVSTAEGYTARQRHLLAYTLGGGLAGGLVDAAYFSTLALMAGKSPVRVLRGIAAFWLGPDSMSGGTQSALLGLATHFGLATIMAAGYAVIVMLVPAIRRLPLVAGPLYGLALYAVMYRVVLPLRWPGMYPRFDGFNSVLDILAHVGVGLAIALVFAVGSVSVKRAA